MDFIHTCTYVDYSVDFGSCRIHLLFAYILIVLQEIVLGISSLSALGPIGAALEVILILYPFTAALLTVNVVTVKPILSDLICRLEK